jgi:hypothetical protein
MALSEYDQKIKPCLDMIGAGANMAVRNAQRLPFKPGFTTHAQDDLEEARAVLEAALKNIIAAQAVYASKPVEQSDAA